MAEQKKVALITGANRGIGFETARQLGKTGVTVVLGARQFAKAQEAATKLKAEGIDAQGIQLDVTNEQDRKSAAQYLEKQFGKLDILINNAGITTKDGIGKSRITEASSNEELHKVFDTNFFSVIRITQELLPLLNKSEAGRIVNLSSILGSLTIHSTPNSPLASFKNFAYNASKTALNAFTIHLAAELAGTKIKVNSVHPGWVKTEMGTDAAPLEIPDGAKTSVAMALIGEDGPNGRFIQETNKELPW
jgi:NAD(P)-dependent dehydrogenase (short-subunit alcohol dehydrogenase family)